MFSCALALQCFTSDSSVWGGSPHEFLTRITCYYVMCTYVCTCVHEYNKCIIFCLQQIGWRDSSSTRRVIVYVSDSGFHLSSESWVGMCVCVCVCVCVCCHFVEYIHIICVHCHAYVIPPPPPYISPMGPKTAAEFGPMWSK